MASPRNAFFRLPSTKSGKWTVALSAIYWAILLIYDVFGFCMSNISFRVFGQLYTLSFVILLVALAIGIFGLIAVIKFHERSWLIWLLTIIPIVLLILYLLWIIIYFIFVYR